MQLSGSFLPSEGLNVSHLEYFKFILLGIRVVNVFPRSIEEPAVNMMFSGYTGSWPHVLVCKAFSYPLPLAHAVPRFHLGQCFIGAGSLKHLAVPHFQFTVR